MNLHLCTNCSQVHMHIHMCTSTFGSVIGIRLGQFKGVCICARVRPEVSVYVDPVAYVQTFWSIVVYHFMRHHDKPFPRANHNFFSVGKWITMHNSETSNELQKMNTQKNNCICLRAFVNVKYDEIVRHTQNRSCRAPVGIFFEKRLLTLD